MTHDDLNDFPEWDDFDSFATNPGRIVADMGLYRKCYPDTCAVIFLGTVAGLILIGLVALVGFYSHWLWLCPVIIAVGFKILLRRFDNKQIPIKMAYGATCPAVMLNAKEGLAAMWVVMSNGSDDEEYPAIKIFKVPVNRITWHTFAKGTRFTCVCTFKKAPDIPYWDDVEPVPVVCVTDNKLVYQTSLDSIDEEYWIRFKEDLRRIPREKGLYFITAKGIPAKHR